MMTTDIQTECEKLAQSTLEEVQTLRDVQTGELSSRLMHAIEEDYGLEPGFDWLDLLDHMALEIYGRATVRSASGPEIIGVTVVTGIGGPHTEFTVGRSDIVEARAVWGAADYSVSRVISGLFDSLVDLVN